MAENDMFASAVRSGGDLAAVFEHDGDTGYFYLYKISGEQSRKVVAAIRILAEKPDFEENDVAIRWNTTESKVGLFIRGALWAAFDSKTGAKYGGDYYHGSQAKIPEEIARAFEPE